MQKPTRLALGNTVALVNPAGMPPERFRHYIPLIEEYIQRNGFRVKMYLAPDGSSDKELAEVFTSAWIDEEVKALFPICGSERIYEVIKHLKPSTLARNPKIFCGSSVLSTLSIWLAQQAEVITFFGPHMSFIHQKSPQRENEFTVQSFWGMLTWKTGRTKRIATVHERRHFFRVDSKAKNVLISNIYEKSDMIADSRRRDVFFIPPSSGTIKGKTSCITLGSLLEMSRRNLLLPLSGHVLLTETMDWRTEQIANALLEVGKHPSLGGIRGIWITALTERTDRTKLLFGELRNKSNIGILCNDLSSKLGVPVWYGFPLGHCAYKLTLPQGVECEINTTEGSLFLRDRPFV